MLQISAVIITFNEEKNIGRCLDSIKDLVDDIVVVDSFSSDATESICGKHNVNFIQREWEGYSATKNFANQQAKFSWVLSLDADEALSVELKKTIQELKKGTELKTCSFNRLTNYCGSWVKHCNWYPDKKVRLFNRDKIEWKGVIHEELTLPANEIIYHFKEDILHYSYYTKEDHFKQIDKFTTIASQDLFDRNRNAPAFKLIVNPIAKFIGHYILHFGFLDGSAGFAIAKNSAYATYLKYKKTRCLFKHAKAK